MIEPVGPGLPPPPSLCAAEGADDLSVVQPGAERPIGTMTVLISVFLTVTAVMYVGHSGTYNEPL